MAYLARVKSNSTAAAVEHRIEIDIEIESMRAVELVDRIESRWESKNYAEQNRRASGGGPGPDPDKRVKSAMIFPLQGESEC